MKNVAVNCPKCRDTIVKSYGDEVKLRSKLLKWNKDGMFAVCKSCGSDVAIESDLLHSIESSFVFEIPKQKI